MDELDPKIKEIVKEALEDAIEKITYEYCSHGALSPESKCGAHNDKCWAQKQYAALEKLD